MATFVRRWMVWLSVVALALRGVAELAAVSVLACVLLLGPSFVAATFLVIRKRGMRVTEATWQQEAMIMLVAPVALTVGAVFGVAAAELVHWTIFPSFGLAIAGLICGAVWAPPLASITSQTRLILLSGVSGVLAGVVTLADMGGQAVIGRSITEEPVVMRAAVSGLAGFYWLQAALLCWWARKHVHRGHVCRSCEYDLRGTVGLVCPECGTPRAAGETP